MRKEDHFKSADGYSQVWYTEWVPEGEVKAVLQIIHGMAEYIERYADFAEYLNGFGIAVAGTDHIGHGRSCKEADRGYMGESNGWKNMTEDEEHMFLLLKEEYPGVPVNVMGHSMGSFIIRNWMAQYGNDAGKFIIMGTAGKNPAVGAGLGLIKTLRKFKGGRGHSKLVTSMAFGSYNKRIPDAKTPYDWLSTNMDNVSKYVDDPLCGFEFTLAGYQDLMTLIKVVNEDSWYTSVPKDHPIMVTAGKEDPVGAYGAGPTEVATGLRKAGCESVELKIYEGMRHEILNENGREQVYQDMKDFLIG